MKLVKIAQQVLNLKMNFNEKKLEYTFYNLGLCELLLRVSELWTASKVLAFQISYFDFQQMGKLRNGKDIS